MRNQSKSQRKKLIPIFIVALLLVAGFAGWHFTKKDSSPASKAIKEAMVSCNQNDKDLCKFIASWKENNYYTITATTESEGQKQSFILRTIGNDRTHMISSGRNNESYEVITIDNTMYTKDPSDGTWWKQTLADDESKPGKDFKVDFDDPDKNTPEADKTIYKKIGKEPCGKLTCFKYQIIDPNAKDEQHFIWFDDKDYQLRRMTTEGPSGKSEMAFNYDKFTIEEPSPVKDMPTAEAGSVPSETEIQQLMQQYGGEHHH